MHTFREHTQEADHLANLGANEMKKGTVEKESNIERWKGVRRWTVAKKKKKQNCKADAES